MKFESQFSRAAELVASADALVIGAGAGMGVDSGLPDFRGNDGFWKAYPALAKSQLHFTDVANPRTFETDPAMAWGFYGHRLDLYRKTVPHEGFSILRKWGERAKQGSHIYTSNVDGQFQKAGFAESQVHECHGSIHHLQCMNDCVSGVWSASEFKPDVDSEQCRLTSEPPKCRCCEAIARPNILMFGDWNWLHERMEQQRRREKKWFSDVVNSLANVVIIELGAGTAIPSVRHFCQRIGSEFKAPIIRINPREFEVGRTIDIGFPMGALEALQGIDLAMSGREIN